MLKKETIDFYDRIAEETFKKWMDDTTLLATLKDFVCSLPRHPRILDLGCGIGYGSRQLSEAGAAVTGIDLSVNSIEIARTHVPGVAFHVMDIERMSFEPASFHGVVEAGVLFHFSEEEQNRILDTIHAILEPEGRFLSFYPEGEFEGKQPITMNGETYTRYARMIPTEKWITQVRARGFSGCERLDFEYESFKAVVFRNDRR